MAMYQRAGLIAQVPVIKPVQNHKYNTRTIQINKTNTKQNKTKQKQHDNITQL
jgi:hypothetical protein